MPVSAVRSRSCSSLLQVLLHYTQPEGERRRSSTLHELLMEEFAKTDELLEMQARSLPIRSPETSAQPSSPLLF